MGRMGSRFHLRVGPIQGGWFSAHARRERLRQLYGEGSTLSVENGERGGAVVTMALPYHLAPGTSEGEVMEVHIGNSRDVRIPKPFNEQSGMGDATSFGL